MSSHRSPGGDTMGQRFSSITDRHRAFIEGQKIFFVASAAPEGRVNVSPKGMGTFRVLGPNEVAYLDCTGSGSETRAHLVASQPVWKGWADRLDGSRAAVVTAFRGA